MNAEDTVQNRLILKKFPHTPILKSYKLSSAIINQEAKPLSWKFWEKRRYIVVLLAFLGYLSSYTLRVNLSVAIVAMTSNNETVNNVLLNFKKNHKYYRKWSSCLF